MKRNTLSYASCIATTSNNTYSLHSATILTHSIARSCIFFSETKHCYSQNGIRSHMQLVPFFAIPQSNLQTLKIHTNLMKIATNNNNFFAVVIRRKRKFLLAKKIWGVSGTLMFSLLFIILRSPVKS